MRIAGGTMRGRTLAAPDSDALRPTQDAVREAVFSMLRAVLPGCSFLDLYAGTGAVGLEALSRGAARVAWVERAPRSLRVLERNAKALCGDPLPRELRIVRSDVSAWLRRPDLPPGAVSVVYADPPYVEREGDADALGAVMAALAASGVLAPTAFFVAEQRARTPVPAADGFDLLDTRRYGKTQVSLFRRGAPPVPAAEGGTATS